MNTKRYGIRQEIRHSEAFKMEVVRELEEGGLTFSAMAMKYGIKGAMTVAHWVRRHGNGSRGKVIRVEKPGEINELKRLTERVRLLESALADANIEAALERACTRLALARAGITDVEEFKKKVAGRPDTKPSSWRGGALESRSARFAASWGSLAQIITPGARRASAGRWMAAWWSHW